MCKVIQYRFACGHPHKLRKSRCGGNKFKQTRNSTRAVCCAEAYIHIKFKTQCGTCLHKCWDGSWKARLKTAAEFRDGLAEKGLPGFEEISALIQILQAEYEEAAWVMRNINPYGNNVSIDRVKPKGLLEAPEGDGEQHPKRKTSLLKYEIKSHQVVLPLDVSYGMAQENDNVEDWICSTDPFHPVTNIYTHPWDEVDSSWYEQVSEQELNGLITDSDAGLFADTSWEWTDDEVHTNNEVKNDKGSEWKNQQTEQELIAWGADAKNSSGTTSKIRIQALTREEEYREQIAKVTEAFWLAVNGDSSQNPSLAASKMSLPTIFAAPCLKDNFSNTSDSDEDTGSTCSSSQSNSATSTSTSDSTYIITNISNHELSKSPTNPSHKSLAQFQSPSFSFPRAENSTRAKYNKFRVLIQNLRYTDTRLYYTNWLLISRMEIRAFEGPSGPKIYDPLLHEHLDVASQTGMRIRGTQRAGE